MAILSEQHQPSFVLWPLQNARTAYRPVYLPAILVVPHARDNTGRQIANSHVWNLTFMIEEAPGRARVAGYEYRGIFIPELERYRVDVTDAQLASRKINVEGQRFEDVYGDEIAYADATNQDFMVYTTENGDLTDRIQFTPGASYYDLSTIEIETGDLQPLGKYIISWNANYYRRVITSNGELFCIDTSIDRLSRKAIVFDHPGQVHQEFLEKTPAFVYDDFYDNDPHAQFYRPFADALQDLHDESGFLESINHIDSIQANHIPYLAHLVGWDLPYFPGATDAMRRRALRNARRLQALKGSKRAIRELFDIFGYSIDIINCWYREDGLEFVAPDEDPNIGLTSEIVCRAEPMLVDYATDGFGDITIPLLYRPEGNMTVEAWKVKTSSPLYDSLKSLADSYEDLEGGSCAVDPNGYQISSVLHGQLSGGSVIGYSQVLVNQDAGGLTSNTTGFGPLNEHGITYQGFQNTLTVGFDRYLQFESDERLFVFVTYEREKITVPTELTDYRSNRFDIRILERALGEEVNPSVLEFLLGFIIRLKAFHSLLRKIIFTVNLEDVYNVTDFCVGGENIQSAGTDAGEAQVPPAIVPTETTAVECNEESLERNFKEEDLDYRARVLAGLEEEFQAWKRLDGRFAISDEDRAKYQPMSSILFPTEYGDTNGNCDWTWRGQDRKLYDADFDPDHDVDVRAPACDLTGNVDDYCYQGRVQDELATELSIPLSETWRSKPCSLGMGNGFYYVYSSNIVDWCNATGCIDLTDISNIRRSMLEGLLVRVLAFGGQLRYTNKVALDDTHVDPKDNVAVRRPSLGIEKDNMMIPGHRTITMSNLLTDFTHPEWNLRPWDDILHVHCAEDAPADVTMDSEIIIDTNGDEQLWYESGVPLVYYGNGRVPDILSLSDHTWQGSDEEPLITHKIFTTAPTSEYVELEGMVHTDTLTGFTGDAICLPSEVGKIYASAVDGVEGSDIPGEVEPPTAPWLGATTPVEYVDYASSGGFTQNPTDLGSGTTTWRMGSTDGIDADDPTDGGTGYTTISGTSGLRSTGLGSNFSGAITLVVVWTSPGSLVDNDPLIGSYGVPGTAGQFIIRTHVAGTSGLQLSRTNAASGNVNAQVDDCVATATTYVIVVTHDGSTTSGGWQFYMNNALQVLDTDTAAGSTPIPPTVQGVTDVNGWGGFGTFDGPGGTYHAWGIWDSVLPADEISNVYAYYADLLGI